MFRGKWEQYNLKEDRTETVDLASKNPEKVQEHRTKFVCTCAPTATIDSSKEHESKISKSNLNITK